MTTKRKLPSKLAAPVVKPARTPSKQILSEARAVVTGSALDLDSPSVQLNGAIHLDLTQDSSAASSDIDDDEDEEDPANFHAEGADDIDMADAAEPSFGDLVLAHTSEPISVSSAFPSATKTASSALAAPSGASLGVALSQALKTSDHALLESCLQTSDLPTIRATIQRLAAPLATTLLGLLAGRLHRRPGRAGSLMVWIQWTLVTHGGYLATQPQVVGKLAELNRVIEERARGLQGLLTLKGKLDLLDAQMQLRKSVREARLGEEEEEDEDVVYVEGEESEGEAAVEGKSKKLKRSEEFGESESEMSDEMPDTLGDRIIADSDDEEEDSDDEGGLLDDEAEETDDDSGDDEEEVDFDDADEDEEDSDDAAAATPARSSKMAKLNGVFGKSR
ncbi:hypothetical protein VE03_00735 [Pseudogymnoascus sp. 23342-1-I1]|nr:hypothetical protein VE03_00735 [Pseudogymnoascus sp. 23342-1-I1]